MEPTITEYRDALAEIMRLANEFRNGGELTPRRARLWDKYTAIVEAYHTAHIREGVGA